MKKLADLTRFEKLMCKLCYKVRHFALGNGYMKMYKYFFKLNFKFRYGLDDMNEQILRQTPEGVKALKSHGKMVVSAIFHNQTPPSQERMRKASEEAYFKNLLLEQEL